MNTKHRRPPLLAVLAWLALATACQDAPETLETVAAPEATVPGDPARYAPEGWPLQIGDEVTTAEWDRLGQEFSSLNAGRDGFALHLAGDVVYSAKWGWTHEGGYRHVYEGHFPASVPLPYKEREHTLPPRFHGKITYEPYRDDGEQWISTIGDGRPLKDGNR